MMNFIALYRGPTVSEARLVAVSSEPGVVGRFIRELAGEADSTDDEAFVWRLWFWTQDPVQIRGIHAGSGLSRQKKSTRRRDYLERSIKNAAGSGMETYDWSTSPESTRIRVGGSVATDDAYSRSLSSPGMRNEDNHSLKRSIEVVQFRGREKPPRANGSHTKKRGDW